MAVGGGLRPPACRGYARRADAAACLGKASFAILAEAPARLCERSEWIANEKRLADRAGLADVASFLIQAAPSVDLSALGSVSAALSDRR